MSQGPGQPANRPVLISLCLMLACVALAVIFAATADASSPINYVMRAQVRSTVGYPYLQGNSRQLELRALPAKRR